MTSIARFALALPLVAALFAMEPLTASARSRSVLKYGAIGLGAAALYNMGQRSAYAYPAPYYPQPYYRQSYGYPAPYYAYPPPAPVPVHYGYSRCHY